MGVCRRDVSDSLLHMIQRLPRPPCTITSAPASPAWAGGLIQPGTSTTGTGEPEPGASLPCPGSMGLSDRFTLYNQENTGFNSTEATNTPQKEQDSESRQVSGVLRRPGPEPLSPLRGSPPRGPTDKRRSHLRTRTMKLTPPKSVVFSRDAAQKHTLVAG